MKDIKIKSPYIFVECKNYSYKIENPEIDQLAMRFKDKYGRFGILILTGPCDLFLLYVVESMRGRHAGPAMRRTSLIYVRGMTEPTSSLSNK
jgi:hypothetical protein